MQKRRKLIKIILLLGIIIALIIYHRPQRLGKNLYKDKPIEINYSRNYYVSETNKIAKHEKKLIIMPSDEIYDDVINLLSKYCFHNSISASFTHTTPQHDFIDTFIIRNVDAEPYLGDMIIYSNSKCEFYKKYVKIGYFSEKYAGDLCSELKTLLKINSY